MRQIWDWSTALALVVIGGTTFCLGLIGLVGWNRVAATFTDVNAAWVQAIGSVLAIVVAMIAPYWHGAASRREQQVDRLRALRAILSHASELSEDAVSATSTFDTLYGMTYEGFSASDYQAIANVLDRLPHHEVRPPSLIPHLLAVGDAMAQIPKILKWIDSCSDGRSFPDEGIDAVASLHEEVVQAVDAVDREIAHTSSLSVWHSA